MCYTLNCILKCWCVLQEARECAQIRVSEMEVEMEAATRDLKLEKQRLQGAMERIVLRYVYLCKLSSILLL
jgi:hypothetical protein